MKPVPKNFLNYLILILALGLAFSFSRLEFLASFNLQMIALATVIYIAFQFINRKTKIFDEEKTLIDFSLITFVIFLIIFSTGSLSSPLFFLIYFLLFGISLLMNPTAAFTLAIISTLFFLLNYNKNYLFAEFLQLASIFLIAPLASIFGTQYLKLLQSEQKISLLTKEGEKLEKEVEEQETQVKSWTLGEFRQRLINIWDALDEITSDSSLKSSTKQKLAKISQELSELLKSGKEMQKKVEE
jgi:cell division protein FtsB